MMPDGLDKIRNARILVVEDTITNQTLAHDLLVSAGCHVDLAGDGREALTAIETASDPYDAVLMDLQMPGMDGLQATRAIRSELGLNDLPIIAVTANDMSVRDKCLAAGANDCLNKPYHVVDLYAVLIRWVGHLGTKPGNPGQREQAILDDAPHAAEIHVPADIAGIDIENGLSRFGQNRALYLELLADFADTNVGARQEIAAAAAMGDLDRIGFLAHAIRSTAGNIGAAGLSSAAADIETTIKKGGTAAVESLAHFQIELTQVVEAIHAAGITVPQDRFSQTHDRGIFDRDEAGRLIKSLLKLLGDQDLNVRREFDELAAMLGGRGHDTTLSALVENIEALEFSNARNILWRVEKDLLS